MLSLLVNLVALGLHFLKPEAEIVNRQLNLKLNQQVAGLRLLEGIQKGAILKMINKYIYFVETRGR